MSLTGSASSGVMVTRLGAYEVSEAAFRAPAVRLELSVLDWLNPTRSRLFAKARIGVSADKRPLTGKSPSQKAGWSSLVLSLLTVRAGVLAFFSRTETASGNC